MTSSFPNLKPEIKRALLALWLSVAVHAAVIGMIHVSPRTVVAMDQVLEARLESPETDQPKMETGETALLEYGPETESLITLTDMQPVVFQPLPEIRAETKPESPPVIPIQPVAEPVRPNNPEQKSNETGPLIDIPLAVDTRYYAAKELDVQPRPLRKIKPVYPPEYETQDASGYVILEMRVENDGKVSDLKLVEISPSGYEAFGREALAAFHEVRFIPARRDGQQVRALFRVRVVFESAGDRN